MPWATRRASTSLPVPGANATTIFTGLSGNVCAAAGPAKASSAAVASAARRVKGWRGFMVSPCVEAPWDGASG